MPKDLPRYVYRETSRHGKTRFYFRRGKSKRTRLPDNPTSDRFQAHYAHCLASEFKSEPVKEGTFRWLVDQYIQSGTFNRYAKNTRDNRARMLIQSADKNPDAKASDITKTHVRQAMDSRSPAMANNYLKALRGFYQWAVATGRVERDPTQGIKKLTIEQVEQPVWTDADLKQYRKRWKIGTRERLCLEILYHCGLALADASRLERSHIKLGMIEIDRQKTGVTQYIPVNAEFQKVLDHVPDKVHRFLPFETKSLGNFFLKARREAGLGEHCAAHGLRRKRAIDLAEAGATAPELMAVFGWTDIKEAELYTKKADRKRLARAGMNRIKTPHHENEG